MKKLFSYIHKNPFVFAFLILYIPFIIVRLPFFLYYPYIEMGGDSSSYFYIVDLINNGHLPSFEYRSVGYPLFLKLVFLVLEKNIAIAWFQCLLTFTSSFHLLRVIHRNFNSVLIPFSILFTFYINSSLCLRYEVAYITESIYKSSIIYFFAFLTEAFCKNKLQYWMLSSFSIFLIIMIRPSGMFLIPVFILIIIYLLVNKYGLKNICGFMLPCIILLLGYSCYNYRYSGFFGISDYGPVNLFAGTSTFLEPKEDNPPQVNRAIKNRILSISQDKRDILNRSFNLIELEKIFDDYYNSYSTVMAELLYDTTFYKYKPADTFYASHKFIKPYILKMSKDAIFSHPVIYFKFFICNSFQYFFRNNIRIGNIHEIYARNFRELYLNREKESVDDYFGKLDRDFYKEYYTIPPDPKIILQNPLITKLSSFWYKISHVLLYNYIISHVLGVLFFISLILSTVLVFTNKNIEFVTFIIFCALLSAFFQGVVVCLVEIGMSRYSFPMEFIQSLNLLFLPYLVQSESLKSLINGFKKEKIVSNAKNL